METNTLDAEGEIISEKQVPALTITDIEDMIPKFVGEYFQIPPVFSAIKKEGKPLYELARAGKEVNPEPRKVKVYAIDIVSVADNKLILDIHCGSGFYVRSLAHDIGAVIGCGAHLSALSRTAIGDYRLENAWTMDQIKEGLQ